jgi:hypothetical protein
MGLIARHLKQAAFSERYPVKIDDENTDIIMALRARIMILHHGICQTLDENGHLADGENCTLLPLKQALLEAGMA